MANKYAASKVYKIVNDIDTEIYIGATYNKLCVRMGQHRSKARSKPLRKIYQHMNTLGREHFSIILIENYPCANRDELRAREEYWRQELNATLNTLVCKSNLDNITRYKIYNDTHKQQRREWRVSRVECMCGKTFNKCGRSQHARSKYHKLYEFIWS